MGNKKESEGHWRYPYRRRGDCFLDMWAMDFWSLRAATTVAGSMAESTAEKGVVIVKCFVIRRGSVSRGSRLDEGKAAAIFVG